MNDLEQIGLLGNGFSDLAKAKFSELAEPEKVAGVLLVTAGVNSGFKLERADLDYLIKNLVLVIKNLYPNWLVKDVAEAISLGSIGHYGQIFKLTLATVNGWLNSHQAVISWKVLESKILESDIVERERVRVLDKTLDRLRPLYKKAKIKGAKGWAMLLFLQIPKLHQRLLNEHPTLEELVFMIWEYGKRREAVPSPERFLTTIRSQTLIDQAVIIRVREFIDELVKEAEDDGSEN